MRRIVPVLLGALLVTGLAFAGEPPGDRISIDTPDPAPPVRTEERPHAKVLDAAPTEAFTLDKAAAEFPTRDRTSWPGPWKTARAYLFNMEGFGPESTLYAWRDGVWHGRLAREVELPQDMADAAAELVHRSHGELLMSKCPMPRHAVVFFDAAGNPLGSVNVCFECTDILVWPPYFGYGDAAETAEAAKFAMAGVTTRADKKKKAKDPEWTPEPRFVQVNEAALEAWSGFFEHLDWPLEPSGELGPGSFIIESE